MRGLVSAKIQIEAPKQVNLHSGVDGGTVREPLHDLTFILSRLYDPVANKIEVPGFYENIKEETPEEAKFYANLPNVELLKKKWREPSLTVHKIKTTGFGGSTVIPYQATAHVSMRVVPDQTITEIASEFQRFVTLLYAQLCTNNKLDVSISNIANYWIADPSNKYYKAAEDAILKVWNKAPHFIREGGSIPAVKDLS
jgi:di- and tripeptidase